jgi:hypothetical protein
VQNNHTRSIPWGRWSALGLAMLVPTVALAQGRITGVSVSKVGSSVEVLVLGTGLSDPKASTPLWR